MILIYTHKITPRVRYIFKHIFTRILLIDIDFTTKVEDFVAYNGAKLSYTKVPLGNEFFVKCQDLLFEQGINDIQLKVLKWDAIPCFFATGLKSTIPFDIFSASFYLITRYEEYLPHIKDKHSRFSAKQSIAYKHGFLEKPIIDIWAYKLLDELKKHFPDYNYKTRKYKYISTLDIDNAFKYKYKGLVRSVGGFLTDTFRFKILNLWKRFTVRFNINKDPYDTYQEIIQLKKEFDLTTIFFFLIGDYTSFDKNISTSRTQFKLLIKDMVDYAQVGLHSSYYTMKDTAMLKKEKERLEAITNMPTLRTRQHFLRFSLPETYQNLIALEIEEDYSMGYPNYVGFRASTCTPFYFYNLDFEIQTPLKVFSFALMDTTLKNSLKLTPKQSLGKISDLKHEVKKVNGVFITVFHNESLSGYSKWRGWKRIYKSMLKIVAK